MLVTRFGYNCCSFGKKQGMNSNSNDPLSHPLYLKRVICCNQVNIINKSAAVCV